MEDSEKKAPSVIDRYFTRWYRTGDQFRFVCCLLSIDISIIYTYIYILKMLINYCVGVNADVDLKGKVCEDHCILQHSNR